MSKLSRQFLRAVILVLAFIVISVLATSQLSTSARRSARDTRSVRGAVQDVNSPAVTQIQQGRIKWRFTVPGYAYHRAGVAADGTIYVNNTAGSVYALTPNGVLKWVTQVGQTGSEGPVSVGSDGTIYVATLLNSGVGAYNEAVIVALNPDGTKKWQSLLPETVNVRAGPNVGPDGKIYLICKPLNSTSATNLAALAPQDGHIVWNYNDNYYRYGGTGKELFFDSNFVYFEFDSNTFVNGGIFVHRLDNGQRVRAMNNFDPNGLVVAAPDLTVHTSMQSWTPGLTSTIWTCPLFGQGPSTGQDIGIDNVHYVVQNYYRLYAINPNGSEKWHHDDSDSVNGFHILSDPIASPTNQVIFQGGIITYGKPGFFLGTNPANGATLWHIPLPTEPGLEPYGQVRPENRATFAPDGQTVYLAADIAGNYDFSYFYAIDTSNSLPCSFSLTPASQTIPYNGGTFNVDLMATSESCAWTAASNNNWLTVNSGSSHSGNGIVSYTATANTTTSQRTGSLTIAGQTFSVTQPGAPAGAPTIAMTYPGGGAIFTMPTTVFVAANATATDGRTLTRVDFYYDSTLIGSDTSAPYQSAWDDAFTGDHVMTAIAVDSFGATTTSAPVSIHVNSGGLAPIPIPTPTLNSPAQNGSFHEPASIVIGATPGTSDYPTSRVEFYSGTTLLGSDTSAPYSFTWTGVLAGRYTVSARTVAGTGARATSSFVDITVMPGESITGIVTGSNGAPLSGLVVNLSGTQAKTTSTAANGSYIFSNLQLGGSYTVTATDNAFDKFTPQLVNNLSGVATVNFTGTPQLYSIAGRLVYAGGTSGVPDAQIALTGSVGFPTQTMLTAADGAYSFTNIPAGANYTLTPSKIGDPVGISAFDASLAARFAAGIIPLSADQQIAADASDNGAVAAFDASLIARTAANIPNVSITGTWKFSQPALAITNLSSNQTNQNLNALLVGDVSGNWTPTSPNQAVAMNPAVVNSISVSLPVRQGLPGAFTTIPITVGDTGAQGVFSYDLDIVFDHAVLQPQLTAFDAAGTLSDGWSINANTSTPNHLVINAFNTAAMSGQGVLLNLKFNVVGGANMQTPLTWQAFNFNEGSPIDSNVNGQFMVTGPTAAAARISGQVSTVAGQPIGGATITVFGGPRTIRVITNSNGFYNVKNLQAGGFYTITPSRVNYAFAPASRSFSLLGSNTDAVFTATLLDNGFDNPINTTEYFVRQHYLDFLGREPDEEGFNFWTDQILECGSDTNCIERRRENVSEAYFFSNEFQETGLLVDGLYRAAYGRRPEFGEFMSDQSAVRMGVAVGQGDRQAKLLTNKEAFVAAFIDRPTFRSTFAGLSNEAYVYKLVSNTGVNFSLAEQEALANSLTNGTLTRAGVLTIIAEDERFVTAKRNEMFVMMEYFAYLRRNPDEVGFRFWLDKLNGFRGDFERGQMVKAFIVSGEYRQRFGP